MVFFPGDTTGDLLKQFDPQLDMGDSASLSASDGDWAVSFGLAIKKNVTLSYLNPLPLSMNLGKVEVDVYYGAEAVTAKLMATVTIFSAKLEFTGKSTTQRNEAIIQAEVKSLRYILKAVNGYKSGAAVPLLIKGANIRFLGYNDDLPGANTPLYWVEDLLVGSDFPFLITPAATPDDKQ
jgi:hypothetical protein